MKLKQLLQNIDYKLIKGSLDKDIINFVIMAFVVFLIVKFMNKILLKSKKEEKKVIKESDEVILLREIRDLLKEK